MEPDRRSCLTRRRINHPWWNIKKRIWTPSRLIWLGLGIALVLTLLVTVLQRSGNERLSVDSTRLTVSRVSMGEFREYYPFDGTVVPETSVFLDVEEGGQVEEIHTEGVG